MRLQKNTLLALYSVLEFAYDPSRHISASEIAQKYDISPHHLAKVLSELARSGYVESVRGVGGGYRFAANARRVTLMDIISLFEDFTSSPAERREPGEETPVGQALASVMREIDEIAKATLSSITLATMLQWIEHNRQSRPAKRSAARSPARAVPAANARERRES
ncbi:MAG TPA: Rrf2 family transcriptional regulator [Zeimonas sp.]|jgi:Rrf2 family protein|nr:Rrf2 family transcriptional regulator [Zeimonas sp.]